jgi:hypothetical protein
VDDKHVERLTTNSEYHKSKKACIVRHKSAEEAQCKYARNGYNVTQGRKQYYNAPRYDPAKVANLTQQRLVLKSQGDRVVFTPRQQEKGTPVVQDIWDVDKHGNFVPAYDGGDGGHHPYKHNWHHMIANEMLFQELYDESLPDPYQLLELLMAGGYNLNSGRNIVLLPKKTLVGILVRWPIHPNNHPRFDTYVQGKLSWLKRKLMKALGNKSVHEVDPEKTVALKEDLEKLSDNLFLVLEQMPGGMHINKIQEVGAEIEERLRRGGARS